MNIPDQLQQIGVSVQKNRLVPTPKQLPVATVKPVVPLGVNPVDLPHASGYIGIRRLDQEMVVVRHQTIGGNAQIPLLSRFLEKLNKLSVLPIVRKNRLTPPAAVHDVVPCIPILYSQWP
jgi:hypothetical protein